MKYFIILFGFYLFNACGCFEYNDVGRDDYSDHPDMVKKITIVNHTNKTYTNNALYSSPYAQKRNGTWKLYYSLSYYDQKIDKIAAQKTIHKNKKGKPLELGYYGQNCFSENEEDYGVIGNVLGFLLLSLNDGKKKIFFGAYHGSKKIWTRNESDCKRYYTWDIHPVWQEKELTITIEKDGKITFSDPKIKEFKKMTASKSKEEIELKNLEIVPCDDE